MRVIIATPLYPPDIAEPAPHVKELARRLSLSHTVTIVTYARHPEKIPGVSIIAVDKHQPLVIRLVRYFFALAGALRSADVVVVENGASVELPAGLLAFFSRIPCIFHIGDPSAHARSSESRLLRSIEHFLSRNASCTITDSPLPRPEVFPFEPVSEAKMTAYERSWEEHLTHLEKCFPV